MNNKRHFLNWTKPVGKQVANFILSDFSGNFADLEDILIIVPTQHSGRRLRHSLTYLAEEKNMSLLSVTIRTPEFLLTSSSEQTPAGDLDLLSAWVSALQNIHFADYANLFPVPPITQDIFWCLRTAQMLIKVQNSLGENGHTFAEAANILQEESVFFDEHERWLELEKLSKHVSEKLNTFHLVEPNALKKQSLLEPLNGNFKKIILACVPDPMPLVSQKLAKLQDIQIDILIHACSEKQETFDPWGRPLEDYWLNTNLDIADSAIHLEFTPADQAEKTLSFLPEEINEKEPLGLTIGIPDSEVIPYLHTAFATKNLNIHNPEGKSLALESSGRLIGCIADFLIDKSYESLTSLIRHPEMLHYLLSEQLIKTSNELLEEIDRFQNKQLPQNFQDIEMGLSSGEFPNFSSTLGFILEIYDTLTGAEKFHSALLKLLSEIYQPIKKVSQHQFKIGEEISKTLLNFADSAILNSVNLSLQEMLILLKEYLASRQYFPERADEHVELFGWLELHWDSNPNLVITGMNDNSVPGTIREDAFLPGKAREILKLSNNNSRLARDAYLLKAMHEMRQNEDSSLTLICSKIAADGTPLRPSRLLFLTDDKQFAERAKRLFQEIEVEGLNIPREFSWKLKPELSKNILEKISVTALRDYLQCPFRFYLKQILKMNKIDDRKIEFDAMDFGNIIHDILERFGKDESINSSRNASEINTFLQVQLKDFTKQKHGKNLPAPVIIQIKSASQRLKAFSISQAQIIKNGWEILFTERKENISVDGIILSGKIDRIDINRTLKKIRIIDYKTTDSIDKSPEKVHIATAKETDPDYQVFELAGKEKKWIDLQLPIYHFLTAKMMLDYPEFSDFDFEAGFLILPKAIENTDLIIWQNLDATLLHSAQTCLNEIVSRIKKQIFWPPTEEKLPYDDFKEIFAESAKESVNPILLTAPGESKKC